MKVTNEHYAVIKSAIEENIAAEKAHEQLGAYNQYGLSHRRFVFDVSYYARLSRFISDTIYEYANDDHLYTALTKAVDELFGIKKESFSK
jgi:hypothetical protein